MAKKIKNKNESYQVLHNQHNTTQQKLDKAIKLLESIHIDASMALCGDWDCSSSGFKSQQYLIEEFLTECGINIPAYPESKIEDRPNFT